MPSKNGWRHHFIPRHDMSGQSGNVFIIIMLGVFLFGALMYMFSRSAQQGTGNLTKQQAKIAAQEILNYARLVEGAVDRVRRNGCSEIEISFENDVIAGYENPNAPADKSCHIFDDAGGKVSYFTPPERWNDQNNDSEVGYNEIFYVAQNNVWGIGSSNDDLLLQFLWVKKYVCEEINKILLNDISITEDNGGFFRVQKMVGDYEVGSGNINLSSNPTHRGQNSICFTSETYGSYHFYHVLLAR